MKEKKVEGKNGEKGQFFLQYENAVMVIESRFFFFFLSLVMSARDELDW